MKFKNISRQKWFELLIGIVPGVAVLTLLIPMAMAVFVGTFIAFLTSLTTEGKLAFWMFASLTPVVASLLAGSVGMFALVTIFSKGFDYEREPSWYRFRLVMYLIFGVLVSIYWLLAMIRINSSWGDHYSEWFWTYGLLGPCVVSLLYGYRLIFKCNLKRV